MKHPLVVAVSLLSLWACGDEPSPTSPTSTPPPPAAPTVQALRITVPSTLEDGQTAQLSAATALSDGTIGRCRRAASGGIRPMLSSPRSRPLACCKRGKLALWMSAARTGNDIRRGDRERHAGSLLVFTMATPSGCDRDPTPW